MKIKEMNEDSRPRERLVKFGIENLSDAEVLALILEKGTKKENIIEISNRLISKYGISNLSQCSLKELQEISGIGFAKACQILALFEFNKRNKTLNSPLKKVSCAKDVFDIFHEKLKDEKQEKFIVLHLDNRYKIIKEEIVSLGILDASIIHPREVFKTAIKESAYALVLVHNHPSGDPSPSEEDIKISKILKKSGEIIGISIIDQIIIGKNSYWSLVENKKNIII